MAQFLGTHLSKLDAKNRVSVPAPFRAALRSLREQNDGSLEVSLVLRPSPQYPCIEVWSDKDFAALTDHLRKYDELSPEHDDFATTIYADAYPMETDKEGRIVLPSDLAEHANISRPRRLHGHRHPLPVLGTRGGRTPPRRSPRQGPRPAQPGGGGMSGHIPVMLNEVLATLAPRDDAVYLDGTFGGGGYTGAILDAARCTVWAIDRDPAAIARGAALAARHPGRLHLVQGQFGDMLRLLGEAGVTTLDGIVLDLGVSSYQIDDPARGFSFRADGPLDMRMGNHGPTAADLVNSLPEAALADVLYELGEERASRRIAKAIVAARREAPIETTGRLAGIIRAVLPPDRSGIDPATRSFQALRIRVNDELGEIERALVQARDLLAPGGRLVVVAFHSLEDRLVKRFMTEAAGRAPGVSRHDPRGLDRRAPAAFRLLTAKALRPTDGETHANPRARSARLRGIERLPAGATP